LFVEARAKQPIISLGELDLVDALSWYLKTLVGHLRRDELP
jgi:hypothetical protein